MIKPVSACRAAVACLLFAVLAARAEPASNQAPVILVGAFETGVTNEAMASMAAGVSDLLQVCLAQRAVRTVERARLQEILGEQAVGLRGFSDPATAARVGSLLGANKVISGSASLVNGELIIVAHLLDVTTAGIQASKKVMGKPESLSDLALDLAGQLAQALNAGEAPAPDGELDQNPAGSLYFLKGLGFYHAGNHDQALANFMLCGDVEPGHPSCHYWAGLCYLRLNEPGHAAIEFDRFLKDHPQADQAGEARRLRDACRTNMPPPKLILNPP